MAQRHNNRWNLTDQQCEVLKALALHYGRSAPAARDLGLKPKTVDNYVCFAMQRMGAKNRREAIAMWLEEYPGDSVGRRLAQRLHDNANAMLMFKLGIALGRTA